MAKQYVVVDGFVVAGKTGGETITEADVDRIDVLIESGRVIPETPKASGKMKGANVDVPQED
jgi:hypothetical protein